MKTHIYRCRIDFFFLFFLFLDEGFVWLAVGRVCSNVRREHSNTQV